MKKPIIYVTWALQGLSALIMVQSLFFKFSAAPESVYIFEKTGLGDAGRIGTGVAELIASVLLLIPATAWLGALLGLGIISGALLAHLTVLGIEVQDDSGYLFFLGLVVFFSCLGVLWIRRAQIPVLGARLGK
jgi:uncharacterized membrane protein YphA (DoxX/SURF4 family)